MSSGKGFPPRQSRKRVKQYKPKRKLQRQKK